MSVNWEEIIDAGVKQLEVDLNSCEAFWDWTQFCTDESEPKNAEYHLDRGIALQQQEKHQAAIKEFTQSIALKTDNPMAYFHRGSSHGKLGRYSQGIKDYTRAIELKSDFKDAYFHRGLFLRSLGDLGSAIANLNRVLELDPEQLMTYYYRGTVHSSLGNDQLAIADFSKLVEVNPTAVNYYNRGVIYYQIGEYSLAIADLTKTVELEPEFMAAYLNLGNAYYALEDRAEADKNYQLAAAIDTELDPQDEHSYYAGGIAALNQNLPARKYLSKAATICREFNNYTLGLTIASEIGKLV